MKSSEMYFLLCNQHNYKQTESHRITTNTYICMNRYCSNSYITLCSQCKIFHRDHSNKLLTIQDISFLIQRLLQLPFKQLTKYMDQAIDVMNRLKLVRQNKKRMQQLEGLICKEVKLLVDITEDLIHQYALAKKTITKTSEVLNQVQQPAVFQDFRSVSNSLLSNLQYNFQKDKFQYSNLIIRQLDDKRKRTFQKTKRQFQELKQYSMKIIQVILADDSDDQADNNINQRRQIYEKLRQQLSQQISQYIEQKKQNKQKRSNYTNKTSQLQIIDQIAEISICSLSQISTQKVQKQSDSKLKYPCIQTVSSSCQTNCYVRQLQQKIQHLKSQVSLVTLNCLKTSSQQASSISLLTKQKQSLKNQYLQLERKYSVKSNKMKEIQQKMRGNLTRRLEKNRLREQNFQKLVQLAGWKGLVDGERLE